MKKTLEALVKTPRMPGETAQMRAKALLEATSDLKEAERIEEILEVITRPLDLDLDVAKPSRRPGPLADFAKNHPWLWQESKTTPGKFTSDAHTPLIVACHDLWLLATMQRGRGTEGAATRITREKFVNRDKKWLNPWFVPHHKSAITPDAAIEKIINFYKNRDRRLQQIIKDRSVHRWALVACFYRYAPTDEARISIGPLDVKREFYIAGRYPPYSVFCLGVDGKARRVGFMPQSSLEAEGLK